MPIHTPLKRTHTCDSLRLDNIGQKVVLNGWVHRRRDHGSLIFIDLRDRFGLTQLLFDPKVDLLSHQVADKIRSEWVIGIEGKVRSRGKGLANQKLSTGEIEVEVTKVVVYSQAKTPPFSLCEETPTTQEDLRLKYRYLDLRRKTLSSNLAMRHRALMVTREYFDRENFLEITTPILARSTPEGARDYLVPSRIYPGNFYALPQSPQLFKQLLMIGGMDRYFQLAPCFRDEDLRSDRQPEFTQLDLEMSFETFATIQPLIEGYLKKLFTTCAKIELPENIPQISYSECMEKYGTDRPDLRFSMPLYRIDELARQSTFRVFLEKLSEGGCVKGMCVKKGALLSRREIDQYATFAQNFGAQGVAWIKKQKGSFHSNIVKFFSESLLEEISQMMEAEEEDLLLFVADQEHVVNQSLDHLRRKIAKDRKLIPPHTYAPLWVVHFPLFHRDPMDDSLQSAHHPFTQPHPEDIYFLTSATPEKARSLSYDIVINGSEVGGGSERIYDANLQQTIFELLRLTPQEISSKFGFFTRALQYGTPPHAGIALGLERLLMLLLNTENIREVIPFPKTQKASDLMIQCPEQVAPSQLKELHILSEIQQISWL